ncbi:MAG: TolC family protein [Bacteroidetes bacterium]|uniref:TolC family protein n=1 Tax=Candidatus Limisoma faecipullorum TaxID=2840854 RepID=A0A9D9INB2_9BACT|nr:TolC family protein [Candidatus Limisoma faecipullorum]
MRFSVRNITVWIVAMVLPATAAAQAFSLDSCRNMALSNNKAMQIAKERIKAAEYQKKEAFSAYLPGFDFTGTYMYNQKELSLLSGDQMLPTMSFNPATGTYGYNIVTQPDGTPLTTPDGQPVPSQVALIPKSALTYDIHNVFAGAVTLTQPLFMGGKIIAMNKMADYARELSGKMYDNAAKEVIYTVDAAYWQVVSLGEKKKLADSYIALLDTLQRNVKAMIAEGVATKADLLNVDVKLNQANIDLTKVENGLSLSRMALAQICGMPLDSNMQLADEFTETKDFKTIVADGYDINDVYENRPDLQSLQLAVKLYEQKQNVARAEMLPNVALIGAYSFSNPNVFNGFDKSFKGMFSVGATVSIPLWHWGGRYSKLRAAKSETLIKQLELDEAKEKVELQVSQAVFKTKESLKTLQMTENNLAKADENLRQAQLGYREGMNSIDNVMEAQTAWLKANSEHIDAGIDVQMCNVYLSKVLGTLTY